jgi:hypothetical protein
MQAMPKLAGVAVAIVVLSAAIGTDAQETNLSLPNVNVIAPAPPVVPPYQRDPAKSYARNPYSGRYRVAGDGEDKSIEFSDGPHNCAAVKKAGPKWNGGYVYMMHASIRRADTAPFQPTDISYALGSLQVRQYDPIGNLWPPPR